MKKEVDDSYQLELGIGYKLTAEFYMSENSVFEGRVGINGNSAILHCSGNSEAVRRSIIEAVRSVKFIYI